ncbi:unnamed protein product, partial [Ectocarpus sp. 13 AM-2016]
DPGFRLGFNSAGSSASVNHLHFQARRMTAASTHVRWRCGVRVHVLLGYPIRALV